MKRGDINKIVVEFPLYKTSFSLLVLRKVEERLSL